MSDTTPMMRQYGRLKEQHRDAILFFRLGDFYEMFRDDAIVASRILGLTLTKRQDVPMCGVPHHAARGYIARLIAAGRKVAICEQTRMPAGGGLAEREIVEVVTPGTVVDEDYLDATANNYLVSIAARAGRLSFAYVDISTGEFGIAECALRDAAGFLKREFTRLEPREVLIQQSLLDDAAIADVIDERRLLVSRYPDWSYDVDAAHRRVREILGVLNLKAYGIGDDSSAPLAGGLLVDYLADTARSVLPHIRELRVQAHEHSVGLDESTIRNLELTANLHDGTRRYSLLDTIDQTRTTMGARMLRQWLLAPLIDRDAILERQRPVSALHRSQSVLTVVRDHLSGVLDIERLAARAGMRRAHAKDLVALRASVASVLALRSRIDGAVTHPLPLDRLSECASHQLCELVTLLDSALIDEPSMLLTEAKMIRRGFDAELDQFTHLRENSRSILETYVGEERELTGITTLKVRYNRMLGHFLEVTKANAARVPDRYVRRQSLANAERFSTERLAEIDASLSEADERIIDRERELFIELRERVAELVPLLLELAALVAELDVVQSFAHAATRYGYVAPTLTDDPRIAVLAGRHPVVEANIAAGSFIPNDLALDGSDAFFALITGPNMAGKSTYLRQTALIVLLAQIGSYVPADDAEIGIVDRIFCRVGASDNLARGESTFLVEMNEAAFILRTATAKSLVIMDEIGRGTSTNDGRAIAQAVVEYLCHTIRPRTLFATHFHALTRVQAPGLRNLSLGVCEQDGEIVFLKRVEDGPSNNSYGIHVARIAGVPRRVTDRAEEVLRTILEHDEPDALYEQPTFTTDRSQATLFNPEELIVGELRALNLDELRPVDAIARLARWQDELSTR